MVNKSLRQVEVSAICRVLAISPCGDELYMYRRGSINAWIKINIGCPLSFWSKATRGKQVHRGILKIRVVED